MFPVLLCLFSVCAAYKTTIKMNSPDSIRNAIINRAILPETSYSSLLNKINNHQVSNIYFSPNNDVVISENTETTDDVVLDYSVTQISPSLTNSLVDISIKNKVEPIFYQSIPPTFTQNIAGGLINFLDSFVFPSLFLFFIINTIRAFFINRSFGKGNSPFGSSFPGSLEIDLEKDKETMLKNNITLKSFAGSPEIYQECIEVVSYLKNETVYKNAGAVIPRGILLDGPPGTGKTLLAKAIASEAESNFISISASEFIEVFVGAGASKIRNLFRTARENKPCIVFIDEIDAVGKQRGVGLNMGNDEREQTLNQLLAEMDGFADNDGVLIIAATNRKDILDAALTRPGRFDRLITVPLPDINSRRDILAVHSKNKNFNSTINFDLLSDITSGFSGAQLKNLLNEAAIFAAREGETIISQDNVFNAFDKLIVGLVRLNDSRTNDTRFRVAVHEAGHAILCQHFSDCFDLKKVSILSTYNGAGGYTLFNERTNSSNDGLPNKDFLLKRLVIAFGGRSAESLIFGDDYISVGASQDIEYINRLSKQIVNELFLDNQLLLSSPVSQPFLNVSESIIHKIIQDALVSASTILSFNKNGILEMSNELLEKNTILF